MDSLSNLPSVVSGQIENRPRRQRVSRKDWHRQALNRLLELARRAGLSEDKLLRLAGVDALEQLGLARIGVLAEELGSYGRGGWE
ncbi:MAG: hypothetical protein EP343_31880 [Deltaproteobacteria bacterium]|nr:MAG: hypothetical protein EP343_31880 [Deltaproteobacteria bacterium]